MNQPSLILRTPLDRMQTVRYIRLLMERAGLTLRELQEWSHPEKEQKTIPLAWTNARGLLKHKKIDPLAFENAIRDEWES